MKKRLAAAITGVLAASMILAGCSASKGLENDNIKITQYKDVEVDEIEKPEEITDEEIENSILLTRQANPMQEGTVEMGDTAVIDFVGKMDGVPFDGGTGTDYALTIGSGSFIPGFEESIVGHAVGDEFDWEGAFPEDYHAAELAGKPCVFTITVKGIVPELTDDFVKSVSEKSKTIDEYKAEVKKQLEEDAQRNYEDSLGASVWQKVLDNTEVTKYPEDKVKEMVDGVIEQYKTAAEAEGMEYEDMIEQQNNVSVEDFEAQVEEAAKSSLKQSMALEAIADKEKIEVDDDTYKEQLDYMVDAYGFESAEDLEAAVDEEYLKEIMLNNLVRAWLAEHCVQVASE